MTVNTISCTGPHGHSVGSLSSKTIYSYNADMSTSAKAVEIKLYSGGFGGATVNNVTWDTATIRSDNYAVQT